MSQIASGPLPALIRYYERLEADPTQSVADFGFSREKIHFEVLLETNGSLAGFEDIRDSNERGKPIPKPLLVPDGGGRSGTGLKPFFCWDNTGYALGRDNKDNPERATEMFAAFRELHLSMREELGDDEGFAVLCRFLEQWNPAKAETLPHWDEAAGLNVVFRLRGREGFVHQSEAVKQAWRRRLDAAAQDEAALRGISLISGQEEYLARLHPLISGVTGTNTTGAAIVSFNLDAFSSYGKAQSYNAPVGVRDAFRYTTALNRLLGDDAHRVRIGDATVVFWTDRAEAKDAEDLFAGIFGEQMPKGDPAESSKTVDRLRKFLEAARQGHLVDEIRDPEAPFYILGLTANASRISVRYWLTGTVRQFAERLAQHERNLEMAGARPGDPPPIIRGLIYEVMPEATTASQEKYVAQLSGEVARAVLGGFPYPHVLFNAAIRRIRADATVNYRRAAILKAYLVHNCKQEVPMALDKEHQDEAYHLGRLFAILEKVQEDATDGKLNSTIKDKYFRAASTTPATVFPRLLQLHQYHMDKMPTDPAEARQRKVRMKQFYERTMDEVCGHVKSFPSHLSLERQGLFCVAYYHQRSDFFAKKETTNKETSDE